PTIVFMTPKGEAIVAANYLTGDQLQDLLLRVYVGHQQSGNSTGSASEVPSHTTGMAGKSEARAQINESRLAEITASIMALADREHGGYGTGQKFIQPEPNDFLLRRYQSTGESEYLEHVCFTLDRMRGQAIHDSREGGYFRTSTGPDWDQPHREKLLVEQAGMITNCLRAHRITRRAEYARMAEDIIAYSNAKLHDPASGAFYGCEDFLRVNSVEQESNDEFFTIIDKCIYTDANALVITAYLDAASTLEIPDCRERAIRALEFLSLKCRNPAGGMFHCVDGSAQLGGWLADQVLMGWALLEAHKTTGNRSYLDQALELADFILASFRNPDGGYFDLESGGLAYLSFRLTLIEQNGPAASLFLALAAVTGDAGWREAALWALSAFKDNFASYGIHAAAFGTALAQYLEFPNCFSSPQMKTTS
ncbi:MAG: hypothetical protein ACREQV_22695, partial [Candidatus Binatia bacterium]